MAPRAFTVLPGRTHGGPRLGLPPACPRPRIPCQPPELSGPAMPQQGHSPAPHRPALPQAPPRQAHIPAQAQPIPVPRQGPDAQGWGRPRVPLLPCSWLGLGRALAGRPCPGRLPQETPALPAPREQPACTAPGRRRKNLFTLLLLPIKIHL